MYRGGPPPGPPGGYNPPASSLPPYSGGGGGPPGQYSRGPPPPNQQQGGPPNQQQTRSVPLEKVSDNGTILRTQSRDVVGFDGGKGVSLRLFKLWSDRLTRRLVLLLA